ncbi:MAG: heme-binding protein [Oligoflexia bacterium]|nr:heme-binding protein [Oligoflexia bacterium]
MTIFPGCSVFGIRSGYEQLDYAVIDKVGDAEVRQYPPRVVAEVSNMKDKNEAFMALFRYISGQNSSKVKVAMTTPVQVHRESTKVAMTAPVETSNSSEGGLTMRFFLPRTLSIDSAPEPKDPRIKITSLPEETYAALTYSGSNSDARFESKSTQLVESLAASKWQPVSPASFLGYDPPFAIPFLRRNEAVVRVKSRT